MKSLIMTVLCLGLGIGQLFACSCEYVPSFCEVAHTAADNDNGLVCVAQFLELEEFEIGTFAYKFKILDIIAGTVVTGDSPLDNDNGYENTDSTIWVLGGESATCLYTFEHSRAVFAFHYGDWFGYVPSICSTSYLAVDDNDNVEGTVYSETSFDVVSLDDIKNILDASCVSRVDDFDNFVSDYIHIFPTITEDLVNVNLERYSNDPIFYSLIDPLGNLITVEQELTEDTVILLANFPAGIYYIRLRRSNVISVKKLVRS